jgi:hypothetical protein
MFILAYLVLSLELCNVNFKHAIMKTIHYFMQAVTAFLDTATNAQNKLERMPIVLEVIPVNIPHI